MEYWCPFADKLCDDGNVIKRTIIIGMGGRAKDDHLGKCYFWDSENNVCTLVA